MSTKKERREAIKLRNEQMTSTDGKVFLSLTNRISEHDLKRKLGLLPPVKKEKLSL